MNQTDVANGSGYDFNVTSQTEITPVEILQSIFLSLDSTNTFSMVMIGLMFILIILLIILLFKVHPFLQEHFLAEDNKMNRSPTDPIISDRNSANNPDYGTNNKPETDSMSQISEMDITHGGVNHTATASIVIQEATSSEDSSGSETITSTEQYMSQYM